VLFGNSNIFEGQCHIEWQTDIFIPIIREFGGYCDIHKYVSEVVY